MPENKTYNKPTSASKPDAKDARLVKEAKHEFPLGKRNFIMMGIAAALIIVGFLLMLGSGSTTEFNPDIFSTRRIVIGPTIAFIGFVAMAIAIIRRPDTNK